MKNKNGYTRENGRDSVEFMTVYGQLSELTRHIEIEQEMQLGRIQRAKVLARNLGQLSRRLGFKDARVLRSGYPGMADVLSRSKSLNAKRALADAFKGQVNK
jgi:hypothetical protein